MANMLEKKYDVRIFCNGENSRNRIYSEDKVGGFNDEQHQKQRRDHFLAVYLYKELVAFKVRVHSKKSCGKFNYTMIFGVDLFFLVAVNKHADTRINQKGPKYIQVSNGNVQ